MPATRRASRENGLREEHGEVARRSQEFVERRKIAGDARANALMQRGCGRCVAGKRASRASDATLEEDTWHLGRRSACFASFASFVGVAAQQANAAWAGQWQFGGMHGLGHFECLSGASRINSRTACDISSTRTMVLYLGTLVLIHRTSVAIRLYCLDVKQLERLHMQILPHPEPMCKSRECRMSSGVFGKPYACRGCIVKKSIF